KTAHDALASSREGTNPGAEGGSSRAGESPAGGEARHIQGQTRPVPLSSSIAQPVLPSIEHNGVRAPDADGQATVLTELFDGGWEAALALRRRTTTTGRAGANLVLRPAGPQSGQATADALSG